MPGGMPGATAPKPLRHAGQAGGAAREAALLEVLLVVVLGLPERRRVLDRRRHRTGEPLLDACARRLCGGALLRVVNEDDRPVLGADVRPLAVDLRRVVL